MIEPQLYVAALTCHFQLRTHKWHTHSQIWLLLTTQWRLLSPPTHQHGGRDKVTISLRRPRIRVGFVMSNILGSRSGKGLEFRVLGVTVLPPHKEPAPM